MRSMGPSRTTVTVVAVAIALVAAACRGAVDEVPTPGATSPATDGATTTGTTTTPATEAEPETEPETPTSSPTGPIDATQQTFILGPQQPVSTLVSEEEERNGEGEVEFHVVGRYDQQPLPDRLWLGWVPCGNADPTADRITFAADGEGVAADMGEPAILLREVNGEPYENVDQIWPAEVFVQDGELTFTLDSYEATCAVPTVFADENGNDELDLRDDGTPTEPFGVGQVTWETAGD